MVRSAARPTVPFVRTFLTAPLSFVVALLRGYLLSCVPFARSVTRSRGSLVFWLCESCKLGDEGALYLNLELIREAAKGRRA